VSEAESEAVDGGFDSIESPDAKSPQPLSNVTFPRSGSFPMLINSNDQIKVFDASDSRSVSNTSVDAVIIPNNKDKVGPQILL